MQQQDQNIKQAKFQLVCICSIRIAAKFLELEEKVPEVQAQAWKDIYSTAETHKMELSILKELGWRIDHTTPLQFLAYYFNARDGAMNQRITDEQLPKFMHKWSSFFAELALMIPSLQCHASSGTSLIIRIKKSR